jgi:hypothetical protein
MTYARPEVADHGTLLDLTEALGINGTEDGASKVIPFHHNPTPSVPVGP